METIGVNQLRDDVTLICESGKGISKNDFIEQVKDGWLTYLVALPLSNTIAEKVAIATSKHQYHHNDALQDALEYFQDYKEEELSEEELSLISVRRITL